MPGHLRRFLLSAILLVLSTALHAQEFPAYDIIYRPPSAQYSVLKTPHFDIIFERGLEQQARETAEILERALPTTQAVVGTRRRIKMPVVLNGFNDLSNGYVTVLPFKQEIEAISIKGNRLSAGFPSWMHAVAPHELVHAAHAEVGGGFGVGQIMRWFSPDVARGLNFLTPRGVSEGIAVHHESSIYPGAGRLNFSLFQMQFRAAMAAEKPWSLAQLLEAPRYSQPGNSFYIGGANFIRYLAASEEKGAFQKSANLHERFPFLGYGIELWHGTGKRPEQVYQDFRTSFQAQEASRVDSLKEITRTSVIAGEAGTVHRRPLWLNDSTLISYISGYDLRSGFYTINIHSKRRSLLSVQSITEDRYFSLNEDSSAILFARYVDDPFVSIKAISEVFSLDVKRGSTRRRTKGGRVMGPLAFRSKTLALQNNGQFNQLVEILPTGETLQLSSFERATCIALLKNPATDSLMTLLNVEGRQGLYQITWRESNQLEVEPWLHLRGAAIYDAKWSKDGRYMLFTADPGGIANVYAFDAVYSTLHKLTTVVYGALEPSLSPDGKTLAFINYQHERYDLVQMPFSVTGRQQVSQDAYQLGEQGIESGLYESVKTAYDSTVVNPYRSFEYLKPRMFYPTIRYKRVETRPGDVDLGVGIGLALQGADALQNWSYGAELFRQDHRLWGRASLTTGVHLLRPFLSAYDLPSTSLAIVEAEAGQPPDTLRVGREERGIAIGVRSPITLEANVYQTRANVGIRMEFEQERYFGKDQSILRPFESRVTLKPAATFLYKIEANRRDIIPHRGLALSSNAAIDLWHEGSKKRRAIMTIGSLYVPLSLRTNTGLRLQTGLLTQNRGGTFDATYFLPRGYENEYLGEGSFARLSANVVQPLWYIENGSVLLPLYFHALYLFGFAESVFAITGEPERSSYTSFGGGVGLQFRFFYVFDLDIRLGLSYLKEEKRWETVYR